MCGYELQLQRFRLVEYLDSLGYPSILPPSFSSFFFPLLLFCLRHLCLVNSKFASYKSIQAHMKSKFGFHSIHQLSKLKLLFSNKIAIIFGWSFLETRKFWDFPPALDRSADSKTWLPYCKLQNIIFHMIYKILIFGI